MRYFKKNFVVYNGVEMVKDNPREIVKAQRRVHLADRQKKYSRIPYGEEPGWIEINPSFADVPCHDCGVLKGQYHVDGCDVEECPKCHNQLLGCGCDWQYLI